MAEISLQRQLEALRILDTYIRRVNQEISDMVRGYSDKVQNLPNCGITMEYHDEFLREFKMPFQDLVSRCIVINESAMQYVGRRIQALEQAR